MIFYNCKLLLLIIFKTILSIQILFLTIFYTANKKLILQQLWFIVNFSYYNIKLNNHKAYFTISFGNKQTMKQLYSEIEFNRLF